MQNVDVETVYNGVNPEAETEVAPEYVENVNPAATPEETKQKDIEEGVESYKNLLRQSGMTEEQIDKAMKVQDWAQATGDEQIQAMANVPKGSI